MGNETRFRYGVYLFRQEVSLDTKCPLACCMTRAIRYFGMVFHHETSWSAIELASADWLPAKFVVSN